MPEIRFHGRGGQGTVVASRLLAVAAFTEGSYVQSFPTFGLERRGAPVAAFTRIQNTPIQDHSQIYEPDAVVVLDSSLLKLVNVTDGLKSGGLVLVNTELPPEELGIVGGFKIAAVNAGGIAASHGLGSRMAPIVNTAILGALVKASNYVGMDSLIKAIEQNVSIATRKNIDACEQAHDDVRVLEAKSAGA
jgi:2-oxoacid:acceptor oxidoreductase gamma subunit (pyruvate/2-ketoisovalerate family)